MVVCEDPDGIDEFILRTGVLETRFGERFPMVQESLQISVKANGLALHAEQIAYSSDETQQVIVQPWGSVRHTQPILRSKSGSIPARAAALLPYKDILHVLCIAEDQGTVRLLAYPADGSAFGAR